MPGTTRRRGPETGAFRERAPLYLIFAGLVGLYHLAAVAAGLDPQDQLVSTGGLAVWGTALLAGVYLVGALLWTLLEMPPSWTALRARLSERLASPRTAERLAGILLLLVGMKLIFDVFGAFKPAIPSFQAYRWDPLLAELDRWLHLGRDPWLWLHALPFRDAITAGLDRVYVVWFEVMVGVPLLVLLLAPLGHRIRFFVGYALLWAVGGSLLATVAASGGPVYFGELTGDTTRFAPLLAYLDGAAPTARGLQEALWTAYRQAGDTMAFEGISAMPSLHVAVAAYFAFWAGRAGPIAALAAWSYTALILVGSVHLGWHYALDGYVGLALAWLFAVGLWMRPGDGASDASSPPPRSSGEAP